MKSLRNDVLVDMTAEEVSAREAEEAAVAAKIKARQDAIAADATAKEEARVAKEAADAEKATNQASAKTKLKAAEYTPLTEDEANAIAQ